jgi:DNA-binding NtrC family response regulator
MSRDVLLLQAVGSDAELASMLAAQHWYPQRATHPDQIKSILLAKRCHVGVVVFDHALPCSPSDLCSVIAESEMEWVAVVPPGIAGDPVAARALCSSFFDYHTLPLDRARLVHSVGHACGKARLRQFVRTSIESAPGQHGMIGSSPSMRALYGELDKIKRARAPVLIRGETGVGKELVAIAVHRESSRKSGPFVPINCGGIPETLIETLLFGHEKGAFTSAHEKQIGSIEAANGGSIFLDEIGDLPLAAQASLLRFLQESTLVRIGSTRTIPIDARVIAATNRDLSAAVRKGDFREDLFYRLNVLHLEVPPLRERGSDAVMLAEYFFHRNREQKAPGVRGLSDDALKAMQRYSWPGNVRELFNRLQRAMVMCEGSLITASDLKLSPRAAATGLVSLATARNGMECEIVKSALERNRYNVAAAARDLSISRVTLYRLLKHLSIRPERELAAAKPNGAAGHRAGGAAES